MQQYTLVEAQWMFERDNLSHPVGEKIGFFSKVVNWVGRFLGTATFFMSFGAFVLPALGAATWLEAIVLFGGIQMLSHAFLDMDKYWHKAMGVVWLVMAWIRKEDVKTHFSELRTT